MVVFVILLWLGFGAGCIWAAIDGIGKPFGGAKSMACIAAGWLLGPFIVLRLTRRK